MKLYEQYLQEEIDPSGKYTRTTLRTGILLYAVYRTIKMLNDKCLHSCSAVYHLKNDETRKEKSIRFKECKEKCSKLVGKKRITMLKKEMSKCKQTKNPEKCEKIIQKHINKEK